VIPSPVGFTCSSDAVGHGAARVGRFGTVTGWYDSSGYENGDECAYVFGITQGTPGQLYNQVIDRRHYLTQEEFSNRDFARTGGGCLQS
jgi:hypothetical protein